MTENSSKEGMFSQLLRMEYEKRVSINVVKVKRNNALLKLHSAELALERKDYTAAFKFLFEMYKTIDEDEYKDEYQCDRGDFNILLFSVCVTCALAKYYIKAEELLLSLLDQIPIPIVYYTLAIVYFYQLKFTEAQKCLKKIINTFNSFLKLDLMWPRFDIKITNFSDNELKSKVLLLLCLINEIKDLKNDFKAITLDEKKFLDKSNWIASCYKEVKLNGKRTHIGTFLRQDIYNLIRNSLDNLLSIRLSNLPSEYKSSIMRVHTQVGECFGLQMNEEVQVKKMKHKLTQTAVKVQNAQTQSNSFKQLHKSVQTEPPNMRTQEIENLKLALKQTATKLKTANSSIVLLKAKNQELEQKLQKEESYYKQQNEKLLIKDQQNEFNLTKLQTLIEVLREKGEKKDLLLTKNNQLLCDSIDLLIKTYRNICKMQKKYYEYFIMKCQDTVEMLAKLCQNMTENGLITQEEIFFSMSKWESTLQQCIKIQETFNVYIKDVKAAVFENRFSDVLDMKDVFMLPEEPFCLANRYFPSLVARLGEAATSKRIMEEKCTQTIHSSEIPSINSCKLSQVQLPQPTSERTTHSNESIYNATGESNNNTFMNSNLNSDSLVFLQSNIRNTSDLPQRGSEPEVVESASASSNSEKLLTYMKSKLPTHDESEIMTALNKFRELNGKLSGLTLHFILINVQNILSVPQFAWKEIKPQRNWEGSNDETSCSICFSLFEESPVTTLKCKHKFHVECIRKWLAENSICAICRIHVTMDEDFPPLGD